MDLPVLDNVPVAVCKECGKQLEQGAVHCDGCGCPVSKPTTISVVSIIKIVVAVALCM